MWDTTRRHRDSVVWSSSARRMSRSNSALVEAFSDSSNGTTASGREATASATMSNAGWKRDGVSGPVLQRARHIWGMPYRLIRDAMSGRCPLAPPAPSSPSSPPSSPGVRNVAKFSLNPSSSLSLTTGRLALRYIFLLALFLGMQKPRSSSLNKLRNAAHPAAPVANCVSRSNKALSSEMRTVSQKASPARSPTEGEEHRAAT
mmetsp:Transcript_8/g.21  ORF Transcript_8/g.21 Transcript_8/m.21 type:complete len:203 (-) Transcript_8:15-623(-)